MRAIKVRKIRQLLELKGAPKTYERHGGTIKLTGPWAHYRPIKRMLTRVH